MMGGERLRMRRRKGTYLLECALVVPLMLTLILSIWQVNRLKTTQAEFEVDARNYLNQVMAQMYELGPGDCLGAMFTPLTHDPQQDAFIEKWKDKGIEILKLTIHKGQWIFRRAELVIDYRIQKPWILQWTTLKPRSGQMTFRASTAIRAPYEDREQWQVIGKWVDELRLLDSAKDGVAQFKAIWKTWTSRLGGDK